MIKPLIIHYIKLTKKEKNLTNAHQCIQSPVRHLWIASLLQPINMNPEFSFTARIVKEQLLIFKTLELTKVSKQD